jgi:simple sugar transport system substrate-binding protein
MTGIQGCGRGLTAVATPGRACPVLRRAALASAGFTNTENLQVNGQDLPSVQQTNQSKLAQDTSVTDIVALDAGIAGAAVQAQRPAGTSAKS